MSFARSGLGTRTAAPAAPGGSRAGSRQSGRPTVSSRSGARRGKVRDDPGASGLRTGARAKARRGGATGDDAITGTMSPLEPEESEGERIREEEREMEEYVQGSGLLEAWEYLLQAFLEEGAPTEENVFIYAARKVREFAPVHREWKAKEAAAAAERLAAAEAAAFASARAAELAKSEATGVFSPIAEESEPPSTDARSPVAQRVPPLALGNAPVRGLSDQHRDVPAAASPRDGLSRSSSQVSVFSHGQSGFSTSRSGISVMSSSKPEAILGWCTTELDTYADVAVSDMDSSWRNGRAFGALIDHLTYGRFGYRKFTEDQKSNAKLLLHLAFDYADKKLGVPQLINVEEHMKKPNNDLILEYTVLLHDAAREVERARSQKELSRRASNAWGFEMNHDLTVADNAVGGPSFQKRAARRASVSHDAPTRASAYDRRNEGDLTGTDDEFRMSGTDPMGRWKESGVDISSSEDEEPSPKGPTRAIVYSSRPAPDSPMNEARRSLLDLKSKMKHVRRSSIDSKNSGSTERGDGNEGPVVKDEFHRRLEEMKQRRREQKAQASGGEEAPINKPHENVVAAEIAPAQTPYYESVEDLKGAAKAEAKPKPSIPRLPYGLAQPKVPVSSALDRRNFRFLPQNSEIDQILSPREQWLQRQQAKRTPVADSPPGSDPTTPKGENAPGFSALTEPTVCSKCGKDGEPMTRFCFSCSSKMIPKSQAESSPQPPPAREVARKETTDLVPLGDTQGSREMPVGLGIPDVLGDDGELTLEAVGALSGRSASDGPDGSEDPGDDDGEGSASTEEGSGSESGSSYSSRYEVVDEHGNPVDLDDSDVEYVDEDGNPIDINELGSDVEIVYEEDSASDSDPVNLSPPALTPRSFPLE